MCPWRLTLAAGFNSIANSDSLHVAQVVAGPLAGALISRILEVRHDAIAS